MTTQNNEMEFERKKIIYNSTLANNEAYVIPLCSLNNLGGANNDYYCNGALRLKRPDGANRLDYKVDVRVAKIQGQDNPTFNLRVDGANLSNHFNIRPVKFLMNNIYHFGLYLEIVPGSSGNTVGYIDFTGRCHDWDLLDVISVYNNTTQQATNPGLYDSIIFMDEQGEQHKFFGDVIAPNLVTLDEFTGSSILDQLAGVMGCGSGIDADMLDGKHYSDIANSITQQVNNIAVGARNLINDSWIDIASNDTTSFACRTVDVVAGEDYVFSAAGNIRGTSASASGNGYVRIQGATLNQTLLFTSLEKERKYIRFTATATETLNILSYIQAANSSTTQFYVEYYKLEIGNKMTDWLPSPEDIFRISSNGGSGIVDETDPIFTEWKNGSSIVAGKSASAADSSVAIGSLASSSDRSVAIGADGYSDRHGSVAVGANTYSYEFSLAAGNSAKATETSTALGARTRALGGMATAVGANSQALGSWATAIGANSKAFGDWATAVGSNSKALGRWATAIGSNASANGDWSTALGTHATTAEYESHYMQLGDSTLSSIRSYKTTIQLTSDIRDKIDISPLEKALEFITSIKPIRYVYNFREQYMKNVQPTPEFEEIIEETVVPGEFVEVKETNEAGEEVTVRKPRIIQVKKKVARELTEEQKKNNRIAENRKKYRLSDYDKEAHAKGLKKGSRKRVGISAQEVEEVMQKLYGTDNYANIISDNLHDLKDIPEGVESMKSANYEGLIPFLIGAVQELDKKQSKLAAEIEEIKRKLS